ncbi:MAG: Lrp/AsnC family transcriptional regulator [Candidatus Hodarchaeales archaeon]
MAENEIRVDYTDKQIITFLKKDSRMTRKEIADKLGIARQTVQNRIERLEENKVILQYTCIVNEKKLGNQVTAIILILLDRAKRVWTLTSEELCDRREELEIIEIHHIAGEYDVMIKMITKDIETLELNLSKITVIEGVARTHTLVCLSSFERGHPMQKPNIIDIKG